MTGLTKNSQNEEYEDDTSGPRIRHPSGTPYPKFIFLREKNDIHKLSSAARLYQDIIRYSISPEYNKLQQHEHRQGFKITDIGDWLLDNNQDFFNHYKGSDAKVRDRRKKENVYNRIKKYLANLEKWGLIRGLEKVDPDTRNGQKTWLYGYTELGYIIAWCLEWFKPSQHQKAKK